MSTTDHTTFDLGNTALVLVDHQVGTIGFAGELSADERDQVKMWTRIIARFAKSAGIPVVVTTGLETEAQGPLLPELVEILPEEAEARIRRTGIVNAWDDPAFAGAVRATGKQNLLMGGITTDVCLVPPALSASAEGFSIVALLDISAATSKTAARNSRDLLQKAGIELLTVVSMVSNMLGDYQTPAAAGFFEALQKEDVYGTFAKGSVR